MIPSGAAAHYSNGGSSGNLPNCTDALDGADPNCGEPGGAEGLRSGGVGAAVGCGAAGDAAAGAPAAGAADAGAADAGADCSAARFAASRAAAARAISATDWGARAGLAS